MLEKYVEERHSPWMIHGTYPNGDACVTNVSESLQLRMTLDQAELCVAAHNELLTKFAELADAFDKADKVAFNQFWY
jgi:hypothetical protein